jgi:hypothetical protein
LKIPFLESINTDEHRHKVAEKYGLKRFHIARYFRQDNQIGTEITAIAYLPLRLNMWKENLHYRYRKLAKS